MVISSAKMFVCGFRFK